MNKQHLKLSQESSQKLEPEDNTEKQSEFSETRRDFIKNTVHSQQ